MLPIHYYFSYFKQKILTHFMSKKDHELQQKLFWSMRHQKYDEAKEALSQGADVNTVFHPVLPFRESTLSMAAVWGDISFIQYLVDKGADIDFNNGTILEHCMQLGQADIAHYFIEKGADITLNKGHVIE